MNRISFISFFLLCISTLASAASIKEGDFFEDQFLRTLIETQSPYIAVSNNSFIGAAPQLLTISKVENGLRFSAGANWHEGWVMFTLLKDGDMKNGEEAIAYKKPIIDSAQHLRVQTSDQVWHGYTYVGKDEVMFAKVALIGKYADQNKHVIEFGSDGMVRGLGENATYNFNNDHVLGDHYDYFYLNGDMKKMIAFKRKGRKLTLYKVSPTPDGDCCSNGIPDFDHPLFILDRKD